MEFRITVESTGGDTHPWVATVVWDMDLDSLTLRPTVMDHRTLIAITTSTRKFPKNLDFSDFCTLFILYNFTRDMISINCLQYLPKKASVMCNGNDTFMFL